MKDTRELLKKIPPLHYLHVLNNNTNVVRVEVGPKTLLLLDEELAVDKALPMIVIPPRSYCVIENPVCYRMEEGRKVIEFDGFGQAKLSHGATEIRLEQEPFPLYPGEIMKGKIELLEIVNPNEALKLEATHDFKDRYSLDKFGDPISRKAGEKWLFFGPNTYIPQPEIRVIHSIKAEVLKANQAIKLEALNNFVDRDDVERYAGEQWIYTTEGSFIPDINEKIVEKINGIILTDKKAIHVEALSNFIDNLGVERKAGEVWLVTKEDTEVYIPEVYSVVKDGNVNVTTLNNRQFCTILNPDEDGKPQYGKRKLIKGEVSFFLKPFEQIEKFQEVFVLTADKSLLVQATQNFIDEEDRKRRIAGEKWLVYGPKEYWPPLEVNVLYTKDAFLKMEGLNLYLFRGDAFFLFLIAVIVGLYFVIRFIRNFI